MAGWWGRARGGAQGAAAPEGFLQRGRAGIPTGPNGKILAPIHSRAASHANLASAAFQFLIRLLILRLLKNRVSQRAFHLWQKRFGLGEREISRHLLYANRSHRLSTIYRGLA